MSALRTIATIRKNNAEEIRVSVGDQDGYYPGRPAGLLGPGAAHLASRTRPRLASASCGPSCPS